MDARQERWRSCGALTLLTQAELVDGFLAWDFDADTAATFFAQQVNSVNNANDIIPSYVYSRTSCLTSHVLSYFFAEQGTRINLLVASR